MRLQTNVELVLPGAYCLILWLNSKWYICPTITVHFCSNHHFSIFILDEFDHITPGTQSLISIFTLTEAMHWNCQYTYLYVLLIIECFPSVV